MTNQDQHIGIVGAGLVGSLLSIYLIRRGYHVSVFERRADMRNENTGAGRSINLALSNRGLRALGEVGLAEAIKQIAIPMHGRVMHDSHGKLTYQPYGKEGQFINSISRSNLNVVLMDEAERLGVKFYFNHKCHGVDFTNTTATFQHSDAAPESTTYRFDLIIAADGAYSAVRTSMQPTDRFNFSQDYIQHGYKEFHIPPGVSGAFQLEKNALHIWPRESFMMIALPNPDGSFTCTLFFPWEGTLSFQSLRDEAAIRNFFKVTFPDAETLMPHYLEDFQKHPTASLATVKCWPWVKNKTLLIGDAAHAIVPFYGQGMNAGFEDCRILNQLLNEHDNDLSKTLEAFQRMRKPDTDAIAVLALSNFVEMRDLVADHNFLIRKKIESKLHQAYPDRWIPLYSMVTFYDNMRYSDALAIGLKQKEIMDKLMMSPGIESDWESLDLNSIIQEL